MSRSGTTSGQARRGRRFSRGRKPTYPAHRTGVQDKRPCREEKSVFMRKG